jgi:RecA/RadA recombinase
MAKAAKSKEVKDDDNSVVSPTQQLTAFLKANKEDHYNFEEDLFYKIPSSSLSVTAALDGGLTPGAHRATGVTSGGKTSMTLDFMFNFLSKPEGRRGIYIKSEGRLSPEMKERSGITFTTDGESWKDGQCFVYETNIFESALSLIGEVVRNNPTNTKYFIIIDSLDCLIRRADMFKPLEESGQVAGGALITSVFLKKTQVALAKRGHVCWFISQMRQEIKINPYEKTPPRQGNASGALSLAHAGDVVLEALPRFNDDLIRETADKNSKIVGHYCKLKIVKSNNEKYGVEIRYPIRYGQKGGKSVWVEREIVDLMFTWGLIEKKGAWFNIKESLLSELKDNNIVLPVQVQGMASLYELFETNKEAKDYMYNKFVTMLSSE